MRTLKLDLGRGYRLYPVYDMPGETWDAITGVSCPRCGEGSLLWAEAGRVPGYRICDQCGDHFLALRRRSAIAEGYTALADLTQGEAGLDD